MKISLLNKKTKTPCRAEPSSFGKKNICSAEIDSTGHTISISNDDDYYLQLEEYAVEGKDSCDFCLLIDTTPLQKLLIEPFESLFVGRKEDPTISVGENKVKINVELVLSKCYPENLHRDEAEIKKLRELTEDIPEVMRVCRGNAVVFDSVRSLETFLPE